MSERFCYVHDLTHLNYYHFYINTGFDLNKNPLQGKWFQQKTMIINESIWHLKYAVTKNSLGEPVKKLKYKVQTLFDANRYPNMAEDAKKATEQGWDKGIKAMQETGKNTYQEKYNGIWFEVIITKDMTKEGKPYYYAGSVYPVDLKKI